MMGRTRMIGGLTAIMMILAMCAGCGIGGDGAHDAVQKLMDAVVAGDVSGVKNLYTLSVEPKMPTILTGAKLKQPIQNVTVGESEKVSDSERTVPVSYSLNGKKTAGSFKVKQDADKNWVIQNPPVFGQVSFDPDLTIGGKPSTKDNKFALPIGVYEVNMVSDVLEGSWTVPVKASSGFDYQGITANKNRKKIKLTDKIKTYNGSMSSLIDSFNLLPMCRKLKELYLNGDDFAFISGKSISSACKYQTTDIQIKVTDYTPDGDRDGYYPIKFDATVKMIAPVFTDSGENDDVWTCQSVQGGRQCAKFVEQSFELKDWDGLVSQSNGNVYYRLADPDQNVGELADVIYAGHGVD
ncbi:hypothetical protein [Bifidobacterium sp. SO1]|uniref:hypothetical protein n=1 Tax=Bifidobacterium sp. SO1 TaxID=2809029 RepID=UPI001BDC77BA|nr:hypothetical protein [Bifidobacterium sp. SO1]MBT1162872.1 hypothetical protein [Bifidobacterium sp. SO1]